MKSSHEILILYDTEEMREAVLERDIHQATSLRVITVKNSQQLHNTLQENPGAKILCNARAIEDMNEKNINTHSSSGVILFSCEAGDGKEKEKTKVAIKNYNATPIRDKLSEDPVSGALKLALIS